MACFEKSDIKVNIAIENKLRELRISYSEVADRLGVVLPSISLWLALPLTEERRKLLEMAIAAIVKEREERK